MSGLINIGFGNAVNTAKVVAVINPDAAPVKRLVSHAREEGRIIDATQGRRTKAVIITQEDHIIRHCSRTRSQNVFHKKMHFRNERLKEAVYE